jgi:predicted alpha/beta superfamily hydrolase
VAEKQIFKYTKVIITHPFFIPFLNTNRTIRVYLPPSYSTGKRHYSVIYMHDGQNLFDKKDAFGKPWGIGKIIDKMPIYKQAIVVGIDNGGGSRIDEYAPFKRGHKGGKGHEYLHFIATQIKPFIDANYRTLGWPDHTWLVGSSLGGLSSFYGGLQFSPVFGKIGVLSPAFWFNPAVLQHAPATSLAQSRFYVAGSKTESKGMAPGLQKAYWRLKALGVPDQNLTVAIRDRGRHSESYWAREFRKMYAVLIQ